MTKSYKLACLFGVLPSPCCVLTHCLQSCNSYVKNNKNFINPIQAGGGGKSPPPPIAFPTVSPNWIKIMTPKLVTFPQIFSIVENDEKLRGHFSIFAFGQLFENKGFNLLKY